MNTSRNKLASVTSPEPQGIYVSESCIVPNAALSTRDVLKLYMQGVPIPHYGTSIYDEFQQSAYYPDDPLDALQHALNPPKVELIQPETVHEVSPAQE